MGMDTHVDLPHHTPSHSSKDSQKPDQPLHLVSVHKPLRRVHSRDGHRQRRADGDSRGITGRDPDKAGAYRRTGRRKRTRLATSVRWCLYGSTSQGATFHIRTPKYQTYHCGWAELGGPRCFGQAIARSMARSMTYWSEWRLREFEQFSIFRSTGIRYISFV